MKKVQRLVRKHDIAFAMTLLLVLVAAAVMLKGCAQDIKPLEEPYMGSLEGNDFEGAESLREKCLAVKACVGDVPEEADLPYVQGYTGEDGEVVDMVPCGVGMAKVCYVVRPDEPNLIIAPHGQPVVRFAHACVHHWLYERDGDPDPEHLSPKFLECSSKVYNNDVVIINSTDVIDGEVTIE